MKYVLLAFVLLLSGCAAQRTRELQVTAAVPQLNVQVTVHFAETCGPQVRGFYDCSEGY